jgi:uncharacterized protein YecE (DUF72 family)
VPLANFWASGVLALREKLGPVLWQFPPGFKFDPAKFESFFELLPRTTGEAAKIAGKHDARMKGRTWTKVDADRPMRHAVEIRDESFRDERFFALLQTHGVALVVADTAGKWPMIERFTADFMYARLHGDEQLYVSGYTDAALDEWARRMKAWLKRGLDVYAYFDNDVKVRSPFDAMNLAARLIGGEATPPPAELLKGVTATARTAWPGFGPKKAPGPVGPARKPTKAKAKPAKSGRTKRRPRA